MAMIVQGYGLTSFRVPFGILVGFIFLTGPIAIAKPLDVQAVNEAQWDALPAKSRAFTTRAQILLARSNFSPGEIDGNPGENLDKAIAAFASRQGVATNKLTQELWQSLTSTSDQPALVDYTISDEDLRGPFAEKIPAKMEDMKDLPGLPYRNPKEKISEKFRMSPDLLATLNPGQKFDTAGARIVVANVAEKSHSNGSRQERAGFESLRCRRQFVGLLPGHGRQPGEACAKRHVEGHRGEEKPHLSL